MTINEFKNIASAHEGQVLRTRARNRQFRISPDTDELLITPASSGKTRRVRWTKVEQVLDRFRQSGSFTPARYHDLTFDSCYLLAILRLGADA